VASDEDPAATGETTMTTSNLFSALLRASLRRGGGAALTAALVATAVGGGCVERQLGAVTPCPTSRVQQPSIMGVVDQVDLLFVIDDSPSMEEEQRALAREIRSMVQVLTTGEHEDGSRTTPVSSLHVGIVSTDMGIGSADDDHACRTGAGRDGHLFTPRERGCGTSTSPFLAFSTDTDDPEAFANEVSCMARLGDAGCHFEQPLEATLRALSPTGPTDFTTPDYRAPYFVTGDAHGGPEGVNAGFLRAGAVLAIVLITDEDDCSAQDPTYFTRATAAGSFTHCAQHHDGQWAVDRYVTGLLGLRSHPSQIVFSAIVGVPQALSGHAEADILSADAMRESISNGRLERACTFIDAGGNEVPTLGDAAPARRIVQVAEGLRAQGVSTSVQSICSGDYHAAMSDVAARIGGALGTACLPRPMNLDAEGHAPCTVSLLLPPVESAAEHTHCAELPGASAYTMERVELADLDGEVVHRERCRVQQVARGAVDAAGWYYDDGAEAPSGPSAMAPGCGQGVAFAGLEPVSGAELRVDCQAELFPTSGRVVHLGSFCDPGTGADGTGTLAESAAHTCGMGFATPGFESVRLSCDAFDRTCQVACDDSSDCRSAGLLGYTCDTREAAEVFGTNLPAGIAPTAVHGFCVNPSCES
jgi:hypothetical protein